MPSEKSARVGEKRKIRNRTVRTATGTFVRRAQEAVAGGDPEVAQQEVKQAIKALDKAAQKGIVHKNNASRKKSRLMARLNRIS